MEYLKNYWVVCPIFVAMLNLGNSYKNKANQVSGW